MFSIKKELKETLSYISQQTTSIDFFRVMAGKISLYYTLINELLIDWYYYLCNQKGMITEEIESFVGSQVLSKLKGFKVNSIILIDDSQYHELIRLFNSRNLITHRSLVYIIANQKEDDTQLRKKFVKLYNEYVKVYLRLKEIDKNI